MTVERANIRMVPKPWGSEDLRPWNQARQNGTVIGELWFQRASTGAPEPALLLKILFAQQPLSIQVHPDDAFARSIGLPNGKTEAWYILSAEPGARIALGLQRHLSATELRSAIGDGSIADLVAWHPARAGDAIFVPAGTIHAIGAGVVIAEIQQHSDATFRLFDHGRNRPLDIDHAMAVSQAQPAARPVDPRRLSNARTLLVASPFFVMERIDLPAHSTWRLNAETETWILGLHGSARIGAVTANMGQAVFLDGDRALVQVGADGFRCLLAQVGTDPAPGLLHRTDAATTETPPTHLLEALT